MAKTPCYPTDFSPLFAKDLPYKGEHAALLVAPNRSNDELPFTGIVAIDGELVLHTDLDQIGVGTFVAEALARIGKRFPRAHVQTIIDLGGWDRAGRGVVVPCPPVPPRKDDLVAAFGKLAEYTDKVFTPLLGQRDKGPIGPLGGPGGRPGPLTHR